VNCLAGSAFHLTPELEPFTNYKTSWVELVCHERLDFLHRQIVDSPWGIALSCQVCQLVDRSRLVRQEHLRFSGFRYIVGFQERWKPG